MPRTRDRASARPGHPDRSTSRSDDRSSRIPAASLPNSRRWSMLRGLPRWGRPAASTIEPGFESCDAPRWSGPPSKTRRSPIPGTATSTMRRRVSPVGSFRQALDRTLICPGGPWTGAEGGVASNRSAGSRPKGSSCASPLAGKARIATAPASVGKIVFIEIPFTPDRAGLRSASGLLPLTQLSQHIKAPRLWAPGRERARRGRGENRSFATRCPYRARACG